MKSTLKYIFVTFFLVSPFLSNGFHIRDAFIYEKVQKQNIVYLELIEIQHLVEDKKTYSVFDSTSNHLNHQPIIWFSKQLLRFKIKEIWKGQINSKDSFIQFKINGGIACNSALFIEENKSYILFFDSIEAIQNRGYILNDYKIELENTQQASDLKQCILETMQLMGKKNEIPQDKVHNYVLKYLLNPNTRPWMHNEYLIRSKNTDATLAFKTNPEEQASIFGSIMIEDSLSYANYQILNTLTEIDPMLLQNFYIQQLKIAKGSMALEIIVQLADRNPAPDVQNMKRSITEKYKDYFESNSHIYTAVPESFPADVALFIETIAKNRR